MDKMESWIENGAQLAWLIDPYQQKVFVYGPGRTSSGPVVADTILREGRVEGLVFDLTKIWDCYGR